MANKISALFLLFSLSAITQTVLAAPPMTAEQTDEGILVLENGNPVLFVFIHMRTTIDLVQDIPLIINQGNGTFSAPNIDTTKDFVHVICWVSECSVLAIISS